MFPYGPVFFTLGLSIPLFLILIKQWTFTDQNDEIYWTLASGCVAIFIWALGLSNSGRLINKGRYTYHTQRSRRYFGYAGAVAASIVSVLTLSHLDGMHTE